MEKKVVKKAEGKQRDLGWQKPQESDSLQKSESPDTDYMEAKHLCPQCHGAAHKGKC